MGLVAIWCQFAQTTFYYPAVLAYVASTLAYVFAPSLAHSGLYTTVVMIAGSEKIAKIASSIALA